MDKKINLFGQEYTISFEEPDSFGNCWGYINHNSATIRVANHLKGFCKTQTIVHELMHKIILHSGIEHNEKYDDNKEYLAEVFAQGLTTIIMMNPNFMEIVNGSSEKIKKIKDEGV